MKFKILNIVFFVLLTTNLFGEDDISFSKIGMENGLSQPTVTCIYQDELGEMWFGTREGVNRYKGGHFLDIIQPQIDDTTSLSGNLIKNICGNQKGKIYIHTHNGVDEYDLYSSSISKIEKKQIDAIAYGNKSLWIADGKKIYSWEEGKKRLYTTIENCKNDIKVIFQDKEGKIFVGTSSSGVFLIDTDKSIKNILHNSSQIASIFEDSKRNIWIGTWKEGLYKLERNGEINNYSTTTETWQLSSNFVRDICEDDNGDIWVGTKKGLDKLSLKSSDSKHYTTEESNKKRLSNESIWKLFKDKQGTIWVGTYFGGINYFHPDANFYTFHDLQKGVFQNRPFPIISNIVEDKKQNLFLCTEGNGLIYYNTENKTYRHFSSQPNNPNSLGKNNIKTTYYDESKDELWLGLHLGGLNKLDLNTYKFTRFENIMPNWEQSNIVRRILPYKNDFLIATYNGLFLFDRKTKTFSLFSEELHNRVKYYIDIELDSEGNIWIASRGLFRYNIHSKKIKNYSCNSTKEHNLNPTKIFIDSRERVWIATGGGGLCLYNPEKDNLTRYDKGNSELKNNYISNLAESKDGNILITTTQWFSILNTKNDKVYNYGFENGLSLNSFYNGGINATKKGKIFLAGMNGLVSFDEEKLKIPQRNFNVLLVDLWINNKKILPNDETKILTKALPYTKKIKLNHKQSMLTIDFSSNNYISANKPMYRYKLEGFSDKWTTLPLGADKLNFINLRAGNYLLKLEAMSQFDGSVIDKTDLRIRISPPFYLSWLAFLFYIAVMAFGIWRYIQFSRSRLLLKTSLDYEKKEKKNIEAVNQSKLRFFTNISHEFRTPLTLISSQVDTLLEKNNVPPAIYNKILAIRRNTDNMGHLIDELLEFRKSEQGFLMIKVSEQDFVAFLKEIYLSFYEFSKQKQIEFTFECGQEEKNLPLWFDPIQLQKVFYNLISNAFKYTPKGGKIDIRIIENEDTVKIEVADDGIGIPDETIDKIFDRFYQVENATKKDDISAGSGIGLALTKNILKLHSAKINVKSEENKGSTFTISMKKGATHFSKNQLVKSKNIEQSQVNYIGSIDADFIKDALQSLPQEQDNKYSMLIVEDNDELRNILKDIFSPLYNIYTANDGEEGLEKAIELQPNIVLTDLMMPKMTGNEMCAKIKSNFSVCHIPVVLLTAQTAMEYNLESLRLGADDYIVKPFNVKVLVARCNNLVNGRKILQEKYTKQTDISPYQIATNEIDRKFIENAHQIIENNLDNPNFDVNTFSSEMSLGRTSLFNKIKGVTGQTPNEFIVNYKMKRATELLTKHPEYNISDISYMLGFSTPKYFAKCFKEHFSTSPTVYRKEITK